MQQFHSSLGVTARKVSKSDVFLQENVEILRASAGVDEAETGVIKNGDEATILGDTSPER